MTPPSSIILTNSKILWGLQSQRKKKNNKLKTTKGKETNKLKKKKRRKSMVEVWRNKKI